MPELPDVEVFKEYFERTSLGKKIREVRVREPRLIKKVSSKEFQRELEGNSFQEAGRRGKFLFSKLSHSGRKVVFHFAMTGNFQYRKRGSSHKHARAIFYFNNHQLEWLNQRKLGKIFLVKNLGEIKTIREMGPEPLKLEISEFQKILQEHPKMGIKSLLMNQHIIAGIGNVYSDEILFQSGVKPDREVKDLGKSEIKFLHRQMKKVLQKAIKVKINLEKLKDEFITPHRYRGDRKCPRCEGNLSGMKINNRTAYYCERCQG